MEKKSGFPIWTKEFTAQKLDEFQEHVKSWKGRTTIGYWHDLVGLPQDSMGYYSRKFGMQDRYSQIKKAIRR